MLGKSVATGGETDLFGRRLGDIERRLGEVERRAGPPWNVPWGIRDFTESESQVTTSAGTELTVLTSSTVTLVANRWTRITARWSAYLQSVGTDTFNVRLVDSVSGNLSNDPRPQTLASEHGDAWDVSSLAAGSHTFSLRLIRAAGTGTATIGGGGGGTGRFVQLVIEDIGPNGAPA